MPPMMTSSNWNIFRVTGHLCGESVNSPHKGQWGGALMFSLNCAWINGWVNNDDVGNLRRQVVRTAGQIIFSLSHLNIKHAGKPYPLYHVNLFDTLITCLKLGRWYYPIIRLLSIFCFRVFCIATVVCQLRYWYTLANRFGCMVSANLWHNIIYYLVFVMVRLHPITGYKTGFEVCVVLILNTAVLFSLLISILMSCFTRMVTTIIGIFMSMAIHFEPRI